jgi:hypothetical protein
VPGASEAAYDLAVSSIACWMGGIWSDAEAVPPDERAANAERRCRLLLTRVYGADDQSRYERLRALDAVEVFELKEKIIAQAREAGLEPVRQHQLALFVDRVADAERETMMARRAGDRVKMDIEGQRQSLKLEDDVTGSVAPLTDSRAFEALLATDFGELTHEVRAIAVLCAMDRMETARGLPKHLKVYAVGRPFQLLFGIAAPESPSNARKPLQPGAWLAYLTSVAAAASHPVPSVAQSLPDRELLAWGGTLAGLADKLRDEVEALPEGELKRISAAISKRLYTEYRASEAAVLSESKQQ